jgi:S-adenosylhomocysteine hydrolase
LRCRRSAWLGNEQGTLPPGVHGVPAEIDSHIATLALASLGAEIDALTPAQQEYRDSRRQDSSYDTVARSLPERART